MNSERFARSKNVTVTRRATVSLSRIVRVPLSLSIDTELPYPLSPPTVSLSAATWRRGEAIPEGEEAREFSPTVRGPCIALEKWAEQRKLRRERGGRSKHLSGVVCGVIGSTVVAVEGLR